MLKLTLQIIIFFSLFVGKIVIAQSKLDEIVVTPTKRQTTIFNSLTPVEVITKEDIKNSGFEGIHEILNASSSISIGSNGGHGQTKSIFMRGTESNHTKVLIDGVELNPGTLGVPSIQHISTEMIDRIEISKGSMSTLYGQNTVGGVINIITRKSAKQSLNQVRFISGRDETNKANFYKIFSMPPHNFSVDYSNIKSDGFKAKTTSNQNHAYNNQNLNLKYSYDLENDTFEINYYQSDGNTEYDSSGSNFSQDHKDSHIKTSWTSKNQDSKTKFIFIDKQNKIDQAHSSATDFTHTKINQFTIEKNFYDLISTNSIFGMTYTDEALYELSYGTSFITSNNIREIFFQTEYTPDINANINFGSRYIDHDAYGNYLTGNINFSYLFTNRTILSAGIGKSFRPPDGTDRFGYGGNQNLKPEKSISSEISLKHKLSELDNFIITFFNNSISNLIESDGSKMQNINKARITGLEFDYNGLYNKYKYSLSYTFQVADDLTNNTLLSRRPKNKITGKVFYDFKDNNKIGLMIIGEGKRDNSTYDDNQLGSYLLFDMIYLKAIDKYNLSFKINNLFDKKYRKAHNYNSEGKSYYFGITTNF
tara:strand:- start:228 stop:2006 length:1779 start_codon:yes stop_codon:yes gene_type:complete